MTASTQYSDFADFLTEQARSEIAALHEFRVVYVDTDDTAHVFLEGDDDGAFYMSHVRTHAGERPLRIYTCGGKKQVMDLRETLVSEGYDLARCLFFIDRDFDDYLQSQVAADGQTYLTDFYSVESYLVQKLAVEIILVDVCRVPTSDRKCKKAIAAFDQSFMAFCRLCRPLMAVWLAAREASIGPNFNNVKPSKVFEVPASGNPRLKDRGHDVFKRASLPKDLSLEFQQVLNWARRLPLNESRKWLRGKLAIWFLREYLIAALEDISAAYKKRGAKTPRVPSALRSGEMIDLLGGRLPAPGSLEQFLSARFASMP